ncbi:MAG TPA: hypothetical protein VMD30_00790, partial [Tepidisphaeraceae bacterium]|nr:hypothetical protein [Tepidisphaeraceae bacterium]
FAAPGHWNDPDMLVIGKIGWGNTPYNTSLTPNEQYTHVTLWCLLSAPLLLGCDLTQLDDFTKSLLTNDEVLAIDQDPLGRQARRIFADDYGVEIWAKNLEDGTKAVGLFNRGEMTAKAVVRWDQIGEWEAQPVRDLWRQKDLGSFSDEFSTDVPRHGVVLIKVGTPTTDAAAPPTVQP